jgi:hypothetical protein
MAKKAKGIAVCKFLNIRTVQPVLILRSESLFFLDTHKAIRYQVSLF